MTKLARYWHQFRNFTTDKRYTPGDLLWLGVIVIISYLGPQSGWPWYVAVPAMIMAILLLQFAISFTVSFLDRMLTNNEELQ